MQTAIRIEDDAGDRRRGDTRTIVGHPSILRVEGRPPLEIVVEDLSGSGFLFAATDHLPIGSVVQVGLVGAGTAQATIVRRHENHHGAAFLRTLTPSQLDAAFGSSTVVRVQFPQVDGMFIAPVREDKWPRPVRALVWLTGAALPWAVLALVSR